MDSLEYRRLSEGKRHFRERPKLLGSALRAILYSLLLGFFLYGVLIVIGHHIASLKEKWYEKVNQGAIS